MKKYMSVFLALSLIANVLLGAVFLYQDYNTPVAEAFNNIHDPGIYGPPAMEIIDGDAAINTVGVTLQNTLITGDLYINGQVTEDKDEITLDKVEVQGKVIVGGKGYTLIFKDSTLAQITFADDAGPVTIIASGNTKIDAAAVTAEASLTEDGLGEEAAGFKNVIINTDRKVMLLGDFETVSIEAKDAYVKVIKGTVPKLNVRSTAAKTTIELTKDASIDELTLDAIASLTGAGSIKTVILNAPGATELQGKIDDVICKVEGIFVDFADSTVKKLLVEELEEATIIDLNKETVVSLMELNGRAGITGNGTIEKLIINSANVTVEQVPEEVSLADGLTAMIGGEVYTEEEEEDPEPEEEPDPEPTKPTVSLDSLANVTITDFGNTKTQTLSFTSGASIKAASSSSAAGVSVSGNKLTVTGNKQGTATITVTASKSGYNSKTRTFTVKVNPIKELFRKTSQDEEFIPTGKCMILVNLYNNDQNKYLVKLSNVEEIKYDPDVGAFMLITDIGNLNKSVSVTAK